jgi:tetratricopeptide (TPR) repeat protein
VYGAWIRALVAGQVTSPTDRKALIDDAMRRFGQAAKLAPKYPDTYVFRALAEQRVLNDPKAAVPDYQRFLQLAPANHPMRAVVQDALTAAQAGLSATTTTKP